MSGLDQGPRRWRTPRVSWGGVPPAEESPVPSLQEVLGVSGVYGPGHLSPPHQSSPPGRSWSCLQHRSGPQVFLLWSQRLADVESLGRSGSGVARGTTPPALGRGDDAEGRDRAQTTRGKEVPRRRATKRRTSGEGTAPSWGPTEHGEESSASDGETTRQCGLSGTRALSRGSGQSSVSSCVSSGGRSQCLSVSPVPLPSDPVPTPRVPCLGSTPASLPQSVQEESRPESVSAIILSSYRSCISLGTTGVSLPNQYPPE